MSMKIITGYTGTSHITSDDDRHLWAGILGKDKYVLDVGNKFSFTRNLNTITISNGDLVMNGTHARIETSEDVVLSQGEQGYYRLDLIVARYTSVAGVEDVSLVVLTGDKTTSSTPTNDKAISGSVLDGNDEVDMVLYEVKLSGSDVVSVTPKFSVLTGINNTYTKSQIDSKDTTVLNSSKSYTDTKTNSLSTKLTSLSNTVTGINNKVTGNASQITINSNNIASNSNLINNCRVDLSYVRKSMDDAEEHLKKADTYRNKALQYLEKLPSSDTKTALSNTLKALQETMYASNTVSEYKQNWK